MCNSTQQVKLNTTEVTAKYYLQTKCLSYACLLLLSVTWIQDPTIEMYFDHYKRRARVYWIRHLGAHTISPFDVDALMNWWTCGDYKSSIVDEEKTKYENITAAGG